jgi:hypothetical protein
LCEQIVQLRIGIGELLAFHTAVSEKAAINGTNGTSSNGTAGLKGANGTSGPHAHGANGNTDNGLNGTNSNAATMPKSGMFIN